MTSRWDRARSIVTAEPTLIVRDGQLLREAMRRERIGESEVLQALRQSGKASLDDVAAIILETNGGFTVLASGDPDAAALAEPL